MWLYFCDPNCCGTCCAIFRYAGICICIAESSVFWDLQYDDSDHLVHEKGNWVPKIDFECPSTTELGARSRYRDFFRFFVPPNTELSELRRKEESYPYLWVLPIRSGDISVATSQWRDKTNFDFLFCSLWNACFNNICHFASFGPIWIPIFLRFRECSDDVISDFVVMGSTYAFSGAVVVARLLGFCRYVVVRNFRSCQSLRWI